MINSKLSKKSIKSRSLKLKNKRTKKSKVSRKNVRKMRGGANDPLIISLCHDSHLKSGNRQCITCPYCKITIYYEDQPMFHILPSCPYRGEFERTLIERQNNNKVRQRRSFSK